MVVLVERVAILLASLGLTIGLIIVLSGFFAGRDQAGVAGGDAGDMPGTIHPSQGDVHLAPGQLRPVYNTEPPTSGPHIPKPVTQQGALLDNDQLLEALARGDVVLMYAQRTAPAALQKLATTVAGEFSPALAASGQAVILARRPGTAGVVGLAWTRTLRVASPSDGRLSEFAQAYLGRGAGLTAPGTRTSSGHS
jgi:hypothetical protein